jgi:hypothetical protein
LNNSTIMAAKTVVLDTLGAVLAGSQLTENSNLAQPARDLSGQGPIEFT